jgi:DNA-binding transcriptional regulator YhcF (GntR family)
MLTKRMLEALQAITAHVAAHGVMPSRRSLAAALGCNRNNANRLMGSLVERGEVNSVSTGGALSGFGRDGVAVFVPSHIAAQLAAFCLANSEKIGAVVADAIALHLDQLESADGPDLSATKDGAEG